MRLGSTARQCFLLHAHVASSSSNICAPSLHRHARRLSQVSEATSSYTRQPQRRDSPHRSLVNPIDFDAKDAVEHLRKIFPPLEFPAEVAERMTTHVSFERGVKGHNGRLGFVGRRVLHTYLLLFLHECTLTPPTHKSSKTSSTLPSDPFRPSSLHTGGLVAPLTESYDDISDKLLNTYVLGEHVGAAWELERVMRWTPAIAEVDALQAQSPDMVLRSSGLYKVRGATVEGVVGGIFHQFGGVVAHRVFHTRVLPHIYKFGLPAVLHPKMREACQQLGGEDGTLVPWSPKRSRRRTHTQQSGDSAPIVDDRPQGRSFEDGVGDVGFVKVGKEQQRAEKQRMGFTS